MNWLHGAFQFLILYLNYASSATDFDAFSSDQLLLLMTQKFTAFEENFNNKFDTIRQDMNNLKITVKQTRQQTVDSIDVLTAKFSGLVREFNQTKENFESSWQTQNVIKASVDNTLAKVGNNFNEIQRVSNYHFAELKSKINGITYKMQDMKQSFTNDIENKSEATKMLIQSMNTDFMNKGDKSNKQTSKLITSQTAYLETKIKALRNEINHDFQVPLNEFVQTAEQIYKKSDALADKIDVSASNINENIHKLSNRTDLIESSINAGSEGIKSTLATALRKTAVSTEEKFMDIQAKLHKDNSDLRTSIETDIQASKLEVLRKKEFCRGGRG